MLLTKGVAYDRTTGLHYTSGEYAKRKDAADYWNNNCEVHISNFYRDLSLQAASQASSKAGSNYGFRAVKGARDVIKISDEKKHNENVAFRAATKALKDELQAMTPDIPMNRDIINDLIAYFKSIPEKYTDPTVKADASLRYAAYYNLAKIYFFSDEPEKVAEYADLIRANGVDVKDCEKLKKEADELQAAFKRTGITTRHFNPDTYFSEE